MINKLLIFSLLVITCIVMPYGAIAQTTVNYDCGIGTVTVNSVTSIDRAWLLTGSSSTDTTNYLGTYNNDDIRINTNNASCFSDHTKRRMVITAGSNPGNVGIGMWDGSVDATPPQNKLLVQNGAILNPYTLIPFSPNQVGILSVSNDPSGTNIGTINLIQQDGASNSIGSISFVSGTGSNNYGSFTSVSGPNNNGSIGNTGYQTIVSEDNSLNTGFQANVDGLGTASNTGLQLTVGFGSSGTTSAINYGIVAQVAGSTTNNQAIEGSASGPAENGNIGVIGFATGAIGSTPYNTGIGGIAYGDNSDNSGGQGTVYGTSSLNIALTGNVWGPPDSPSTGSTCIGVYGSIHADNDAGYFNYGIWGDLSGIHSPSTPGSIPYFAIFGIQPTSPSSYSNTINTIPTGDNLFAGYFVGDVYASNYYYPSDPKLKDNIQEYTNALAQISKLPVKQYTFKTSEYSMMNLPEGRQFGILATDFKSVFPNLVKGALYPGDKKKGTQSVSFEAVNYSALIPVLVEAVQELNAKTDSITTNNTLTNTIATQQAQIADLNKQLAELKNMIVDICNTGCAALQNNIDAVGTGSVILYQSSPNPTSGSAVIGYSISIPFLSATIQVSDNVGKLIRQFPLPMQQGAGSVTFDGSAVVDGAYTYSLIIDGKVYDSKSMVIVTNK